MLHTSYVCNRVTLYLYKFVATYSSYTCMQYNLVFVLLNNKGADSYFHLKLLRMSTTRRQDSSSTVHVLHQQDLSDRCVIWAIVQKHICKQPSKISQGSHKDRRKKGRRNFKELQASLTSGQLCVYDLKDTRNCIYGRLARQKALLTWRTLRQLFSATTYLDDP